MKKTVVYVRRSLNEKKQKTSILYQIYTCRQFAKQQGWIVHEVFNEGEKSARSSELEERKEIWRLMNEIKSGFIERIIVFKRDRISRRADQYMEFVELIRTNNVTMHFSGDNEPQMFDGVVGDFIELLFGAIAEHEGNNIMQRLVQSRIGKVQQGEWGGGRIPKFYYNKEIKTGEKQLTLSENNKKLIQRIYEIVANGNFKTVKLAKTALAKEGYKDINLPEFIPKELHKGWVTAVFDGVLIRSESVNSRLKAVEEELWNAANEKLKKMDDAIRDKDTNVVNPKLEGLLTCEICKQPLVVKKGYYCCPNDKEILKISVSSLDDLVLNKVYTYMMTHVLKNKAEITTYATKRLITQLEKDIETNTLELKKAKEKLLERTRMCMDSSKFATEEMKKEFLSAYVKQYRDAYKKVKELKIEREQTKERITLALKKMLPIPSLQSLSNYKEKELLRFFINRIVVNSDYKGEIIFRNYKKEYREESNCHKREKTSTND